MSGLFRFSTSKLHVITQVWSSLKLMFKGQTTYLVYQHAWFYGFSVTVNVKSHHSLICRLKKCFGTTFTNRIFLESCHDFLNIWQNNWRDLFWYIYLWVNCSQLKITSFLIFTFFIIIISHKSTKFTFKLLFEQFNYNNALLTDII
jgi:hypothetical protein